MQVPLVVKAVQLSYLTKIFPWKKKIEDFI